MAQPFARLDRRRTFEAIADEIRDAIAAERYPPGTRLPPERELAAQFGVGRGALREAVRVLEHAGLIEIRRGRAGGTFVRARGVFVEHVFAARSLVEPSLAEAAASAASRDDLRALAETLKAEAAALVAGAAHHPEFVDFHAVIARSLANPLVIEIVDAVDRASRLLRVAAVPARAAFVDAHREHERIYDAIRRRRPAAARAAMTEHLRAMEERYIRSIARPRAARSRPRREVRPATAASRRGASAR